jgi:hypothetical protein
MTTKQQAKLDELERQMRDNAYAITNLVSSMEFISPAAAGKALEGIQQYLRERAEELATINL